MNDAGKLEMLGSPLSKVEAPTKIERLPVVNIEEPQFSIPALGSSGDQLKGHDIREPATESLERVGIESSPARAVDGVQVLHDKETSILMPHDKEGGLQFSHLEHGTSQTRSSETTPVSDSSLNQHWALHGSASSAISENDHNSAKSDRPAVVDGVHNSVNATGSCSLLYDIDRDTSIGVTEYPNTNGVPSAIDIIPGDEGFRTIIHENLDEATQIRSSAITSEAPTTTIKEATLPGTADSTTTTAETDPRDSMLNAMQLQYTESTNHNEAEFEIDSSPLQSSSSDLSSSSSSSEDSDDDYEMLDPEEQARRLVQEDGGSDDETGRKDANGSFTAPLRTLNEKPDEVVEKPNIIVTPEVKVGELGNVETIVENLALIKAKISGEYQVLETGSVLCLEDRTVIGVVAETLGRVQQPLYSVRFTNAAAVAEAGIAKGVRIFYVEPYSTYVFTQPLRAFRGSDASNIHDEEVGDDELEFSDDEAEAEYKRSRKMQKQARRGCRGTLGKGNSRGPRPVGFEIKHKGDELEMDYGEVVNMKYDDNAQDDEPYTPLVRPTNLHEMMNYQHPPLETRRTQDTRYSSSTASHGRGDGPRARTDHNKGGRGRGRGPGNHRGGQGGRGGRGGFQDRKSDGIQSPSLPPKPTNSLPVAAPISPYSSMGPPQLQMAPPAPYPQTPLYSPQQYQIPPTHGYESYQQAQYPSSYNQAPQCYSYQPPFPQNHSGPHLTNQLPQYGHQQPPRALQQGSPSSDIPPGAFVNPAFFSHQFSQSPQQQRFSASQPLQPPALPPNYAFGERKGQTRMSPGSDAAFKAAQDRLEVLRQLSGGSGSPS